MYQFNFINTIIRFSQDYTVTTNRNIALVLGREVPTSETFSNLISLQPTSNEVLEMLPSGDWDSADYIGFQYPTSQLPIKKDELLGTKYGDLKCVELQRWDDYGVYITGWTRLDAYQQESAVV